MNHTWTACLVAGGAAAALLLACALGTPAAENAPKAGANVCLRGNLANCRIQFERARKGHVAFIGGSITEMEGYRPMVSDLLKRRFPNTEFTFTAAGISSTCSTSSSSSSP
jgi:hypothetical protein